VIPVVAVVFRIMGNDIICMGKSLHFFGPSESRFMVNEGNTPRFSKVYGCPILDAIHRMVSVLPTLRKAIIVWIIFKTDKTAFCMIASPMKIRR
jgi:hypothetical protein